MVPTTNFQALFERNALLKWVLSMSMGGSCSKKISLDEILQIQAQLQMILRAKLVTIIAKELEHAFLMS